MKQALYNDFKKAREERKTTERWWFKCRAKQLLKDLYPDESKVSDQWSFTFTNCFEI